LTDRLKSMEIDQKGEKSGKFELLLNASESSGDYQIQPRSMFYEHLKFTDATVHYVEFHNPIAGDPNNGNMKVQALTKIGGKWNAAEDWTEKHIQTLLPGQEKTNASKSCSSSSATARSTAAPKCPTGFRRTRRCV